MKVRSCFTSMQVQWKEIPPHNPICGRSCPPGQGARGSRAFDACGAACGAQAAVKRCVGRGGFGTSRAATSFRERGRATPKPPGTWSAASPGARCAKAQHGRLPQPCPGAEGSAESFSSTCTKPASWLNTLGSSRTSALRLTARLLPREYGVVESIE